MAKELGETGVESAVVPIPIGLGEPTETDWPMRPVTRRRARELASVEMASEAENAVEQPGELEEEVDSEGTGASLPAEKGSPPAIVPEEEELSEPDTVILEKQVDVAEGEREDDSEKTVSALSGAEEAPFGGSNCSGNGVCCNRSGSGRQECVIDLASQSLCLTVGQDGPEPDEYHLDTLIAKYALYPELQAILHKHVDAFANHKYDCGCMSVTVDVDGGDVPAPKQHSYPDQATPYISKGIKSLLAQGVLRRCTSTANSPLWPIKKPDGSWRFTIDYRQLNQVTPTCAPTVAKMPDLIKSFDLEAKWFSVLDIGNSFWTLPVARESQNRFAFSFQGVQYSWTRLPQGYKNSPALFHAQMQQVLT
ncbi:unnamed protein product [Caretta caretta]